MTDSASIPDRPARTHRLRSWLLQFVGATAIVAVGLGVARYLVATKPEPEETSTAAPARLVRVMEASRARHRCSTTAYGKSRASRDWKAIAETSGAAEMVAARFEVGEVLSRDTLLVQIDPTDYELAQRRYESEARAREAQLNELRETEDNLRKIREFQSQQLDLAQKDLDRIQGLLDEGAVTESQADSARTVHLNRLLAFQETVNSLTLIPMLRARAQAEQDAANVQVEQAKREIEKCAIRLPFDARCAAKAVEQDQYVNVGQQLGVFLNLNSAEVVAMVEAGKGGVLFPRGIPGIGSIDLQRTAESDEALRFALGLLDAEIHWGTPSRRGKVTRIGSGLDPATQTFPVIIEVDDPYTELIPGVRPPLVPDVFCEVTLYGATVDDVVVIPRDCLHEMPRTSLGDELVPVVYLLQGGRREETDGKTCFEDGRLKIQEVEILVLEDDLAVLQSGVDQGDLVVLGDLYVPREHWGAREFGPASEAMPLRGQLQTPTTLHRTGPPALAVPGGPSTPAGEPEVAR